MDFEDPRSPEASRRGGSLFGWLGQGGLGLSGSGSPNRTGTAEARRNTYSEGGGQEGDEVGLRLVGVSDLVAWTILAGNSTISAASSAAAALASLASSIIVAASSAAATNLTCKIS
jgi:hypothetical protein